MLEQITPIVLTFNEENNIGRTLSRLAWAGRVVIVDSFSTDRTLDIAREFANVTIDQRAFDSHAEQWNFALRKVETEWALALDADYYLPGDFVDELDALKPADNIAGYRAAFVYAIGGKPLRGSLYPPNVVLFRRKLAAFVQDGHTQRLDVRGPIQNLNARIIHDDRKPVERWLNNQVKYMKLERDAMSARHSGRLSRRLRSIPLVAPMMALFYTLFVKGAILDGWAGIRYASERCAAEWILTLFILENKTKADSPPP